MSDEADSEPSATRSEREFSAERASTVEDRPTADEAVRPARTSTSDASSMPLPQGASDEDFSLPDVDSLLVPVEAPAPEDDPAVLRPIDRARRVPVSPAPASRSSLTVHGLRIAVSSQIGERSSNEDAHVIADLNVLAREAARGKVLPSAGLAVGVYDGHADHIASSYVAQELPFQLVLNRNFPEAPEMALIRAYEYTHRRFAAFAAIDNVNSGTTALTALFLGPELWVANAGDCRAVLVHVNGDGTALSTDHSPEAPDERARVEGLGGEITEEDGTFRVNGVLSVTRGIGDVALRPWVTERPEVRHVAPSRNDACIVLACDGLWAVIETDDLAAEAAAAAQRGETPDEFAAAMCAGAIGAGCSDNVTVAVVVLPGGWEALAKGESRPEQEPLAATFDDPEAEAAAAAAARAAVTAGRSVPLTDAILGRCSVL